ncbi:putative acetyltransferase [compost metagenome]
MRIRASRPEDAEDVAPLLYAAIGEIAFLLTGAQDPEHAIASMNELYQLPNHRLSYENTLVAEVDGRPIGFVLFYHGSRMDELDRPLLERLEAATGHKPHPFPKEARENEFYLDSLAVDPSFRGQGVGTLLMAAFEAEAVRLHYDRVSLIVDQDKPKAKQLYMGQGYIEDDVIEILGHPYHHMIKEIKLS